MEGTEDIRTLMDNSQLTLAGNMLKLLELQESQRIKSHLHLHPWICSNIENPAYLDPKNIYFLRNWNIIGSLQTFYLRMCYSNCCMIQYYRIAKDSSPFQQWLEYMKGLSGILTLGGSGGARCSLNKILIQVWNYIIKLSYGVQCDF